MIQENEVLCLVEHGRNRSLQIVKVRYVGPTETGLAVMSMSIQFLVSLRPTALFDNILSNLEIPGSRDENGVR